MDVSDYFISDADLRQFHAWVQAYHYEKARPDELGGLASLSAAALPLASSAAPTPGPGSPVPGPGPSSSNPIEPEEGVQ